MKQSNRITQSYYYARASARNVLSHIRQWVCFTIFFGLCLLPASIDNVILFAELMAVTSGYDHIKNIIGSLGFLHKILDIPFDRDSFRLRLTLQSLKRKLARDVRPKVKLNKNRIDPRVPVNTGGLASIGKMSMP